MFGFPSNRAVIISATDREGFMANTGMDHGSFGNCQETIRRSRITHGLKRTLEKKVAVSLQREAGMEQTPAEAHPTGAARLPRVAHTKRHPFGNSDHGVTGHA
jgi:hypothetical protein